MKKKYIALIALIASLSACKIEVYTPSNESSSEESFVSETSQQSDESTESIESIESVESTESTSSEESSSSQESTQPSESQEVPDVPIENKDLTDIDEYYSSLTTWENGEDLINKLHEIISNGYQSLKYEGNWATNQGADQSLNDLEMVNLLYSSKDDMITNTYSNGKGWQREHAYAASLMTGFTSGDAVGVHKGRATDFHNLFAASYSGNTSRGNKNYGMADPSDSTYQDLGDYKSDRLNFEPAATDKGKVSRAIFYMATMYNQPEEETVKVTLNYNAEDKETYGKSSTSVSIPVTYAPLTIVEDYVPYSKVTYTQWYYQETEAIQDLVNQYGEGAEGYAAYSMANCQFAIGNLSTLLTWNNANEVDYQEYQHNEYVYVSSGQGNRNPFVDFPELVDYAFGSKKDQSGSLSSLTSSYVSLDMDDDSINNYALAGAIREFGVGETFSKDSYRTVGVKKNLQKVEASYTDTTPEYTFVEADANAGSKDLTINTPINDLSLNVVVNKASIADCSYQHVFASKSEGAKGNKTLSGVEWNIDWTNNTGAVGNRDSTYGLAFGVKSGSKYMGTLTIKTTQSLKVNKVFIKTIGSASSTLNYHIYVGEELITEGTIVRTNQDGPELVGINLSSAKTGIIKYVFDGSAASAGVVYVHTLAFNEVS